METVKEKLANLVNDARDYHFNECDKMLSCAECDYKNTNCACLQQAEYLIQNGVTIIPESGIGDMSDGYHTFNELYHHRALLFATICNMHPDKAWKAKKHDDGSMYDGMFIVGIETASGQATYHYDIEPYWDVFHVRELEKAPVWDGHTPEEALQRITTLQNTDKWVSVDERFPEENGEYVVVIHGEIRSTCLEFYDEEWFDEYGNTYKVLYWTELPSLPEPPKGVQ